MVCILSLPSRGAGLRLLAGGLLLALAIACGSGDGVGPSAETTLPTDSTLATVPDTTGSIPTDSTAVPVDSAAAPVDSSATPPVDSSGIGTGEALLDTRSRLPGIVFASFGIPSTSFNSVHTGAIRGGGDSKSLVSLLTDARARGARIIVQFSRGRGYAKNSDGTFSLTKWKASVDRLRTANIGSFIADGTLLGHFLIDEPHMAGKWGGKVISHATLEAMAQYSKQIWPDLNTLVHTKMSWLASTSMSYRYLDAGWVQYQVIKGPVATWVSSEVASAKLKGLGLVMGLNVLNGGNGSSGIRGTKSGSYSMSASELRSYGSAVLDQSYTCAFVMWEHRPTYYGRTDIASAMSALSVKAKAHVKTSCRQ
jgi:hypothetical protein